MTVDLDHKLLLPIENVTLLYLLKSIKTKLDAITRWVVVTCWQLTCKNLLLLHYYILKLLSANTIELVGKNHSIYSIFFNALLGKFLVKFCSFDWHIANRFCDLLDLNSAPFIFFS